MTSPGSAARCLQVLGDQAVVDPSKVEALVMGQVAKRKAEHEARNQAAKLTPEERREKKKKKLLEDTSKELQVTSVFVFMERRKSERAAWLPS